MWRLLWILAACLVSSPMVFGEGTVAEQSPVTTGTQLKTLHTNQNANGTAPPATQGRAIRPPSAPTQELPGNSNPANASTGGGGANGQAIRPSSSQSGTPGTANTPNGRDNTDNGVRRSDAGKSPGDGSSPIPNTNQGTFSLGQWLWIALAFVFGLIVMGRLASRKRVREKTDFPVPGARTEGRDDQIRKAG